LKNYQINRLDFLNPRRDDWDSTWADKSDKLVEQIVWELSAMEWHIL
jgi:hypothetical protein